MSDDDVGAARSAVARALRIGETLVEALDEALAACKMMSVRVARETAVQALEAVKDAAHELRE